MGDDVLGQEREKESEFREGRGGRVCATLEPHRFAKVWQHYSDNRILIISSIRNLIRKVSK